MSNDKQWWISLSPKIARFSTKSKTVLSGSVP